MTTTTYSIHDIAGQFDRLFPDQVDETPREWGYGYEAGHCGHDAKYNDFCTVGWFCAAGSTGDPVLDIHHEDVQRAGEIIAALPDGTTFNEMIKALAAGNVRHESRV